MPLFDFITVEDIKSRVLARMAEQGLDTREGSFADEMAGPMALEIWKVYQSLSDIEPIVFVTENSGEYLLRECAKYGITPKAGTPAEVALVIEGEDGATIPEGSLFLTAGGVQFRTTVTATIREGSVTVPAQSVEVGEQGNVEADEIDRQLVSLPGVRSVRNWETAQGGTDPETHASLFARLDARRKSPPTSGNASHYRGWALEVDGVGDAKVLPCIDGPGSVGVLLIGPDGSPVDDAVVLRCREHIEAEMPIGPALTVASAQPLVLRVEAAVSLHTGYDIDAVTEAYRERLAVYLKTITFDADTLPISRLIWLLGDVDGIADYSDLTVNGGRENVPIASNQVPVVGEVSFGETPA